MNVLKWNLCLEGIAVYGGDDIFLCVCVCVCIGLSYYFGVLFSYYTLSYITTFIVYKFRFG